MSVMTLDWNKYKQAAIDIACEGAVLLKNDREALPVSKDSPYKGCIIFLTEHIELLCCPLTELTNSPFSKSIILLREADMPRFFSFL